MNRAPASPLAPAEAIEVIERSLRCFACGLAALVPGLGLFPAGYAFWAAHRVRTRCRGVWNPAAQYVDLGVWCACAGLLLTVVLLGWWFAVVSNDGSHATGCGGMRGGD